MQEILVLAPYPVAHGHDLGYIVHSSGDQALEYVPRRSDRQNEQQQEHRQHHVELAQTLDADVESREHRNGGEKRDHDYEHDIGEIFRRNAEQVVQTAYGLLGSQSERGRETEQRGEYGEHVYHVSAPAPHGVAEYGMEHRTDGERKPAVETEKRETQARGRVERPRGEAPVKGRRGYADGLKGLSVGGIDSERRIPEVVHRFQHAVEKQADGYSRGEDHREPREPRVIGRGVPAAYAHLAHGRENQEETGQDAYVAGAEEKPVELRRDPDARGPQRFRRPFLEQQRPDYENEYRDPGDHEHRNVYVKPEYLQIVPPGDGMPLAAVHAFFSLSGATLFI